MTKDDLTCSLLVYFQVHWFSKKTVFAKPIFSFEEFKMD